jgi:hypothetical protein
MASEAAKAFLKENPPRSEVFLHREDILYLHCNGLSKRQILKYLKEKHDVSTTNKTLNKILKNSNEKKGVESISSDSSDINSTNNQNNIEQDFFK